MKILINIFVLLLSLTSLSYSQQSKINSILSEKLNKTSENEKIPVYITFKDHLRLKDFEDIGYDTPKKERRKIVIDRLQKYAANSQREVKRFLDAKISSGKAGKYEVVWIANMLILKADKSVVSQLANSKNNIESICYDGSNEKIPLDNSSSKIPFLSSSTSSSTIDPGITLMKADQCWALGNTGKGVLIGDIDIEGFWWQHPDLVHGIWQNLGEDANHNGRTIDFQSGTGSTYDAGDLNGIDDDGNGKVDDLIGWDYINENNNITTGAKGTASLGSILGDGTGGTNTGAAPGSKCMLMKNNIIGESYQWEACQYGVEMEADIISSSIGFHWYDSDRPDYSAFRNVTDMCLAAGVIHPASIGNDGTGNHFTEAPVPVNIPAAACCPPPWLHPDQLKRGGLSAVVGVGNVSCLTDIIVDNSSYGAFT